MSQCQEGRRDLNTWVVCPMGDPVPDVEMTVAIRDGVLPTGPGLYYMSLYINSLMLPTSPSCLVSEETEPQTGYIACCRTHS